MYAVIVHASSEAQARDVVPQLVPLMELKAETLHAMCARGFVTVEASLSREEGSFLMARLQALGLPAELVSENDLMRRVEQAPTSSAPLERGFGELVSVPSVSLFDDGEWDELEDLIALDDDDSEALPPLSTSDSSPHEGDEAPAAGGWGALFPELERGLATPPVRVAEDALPSPSAGQTSSSSSPPASPPALSFGAEPVHSPQVAFGAEPVRPLSEPLQAPARPPLPDPLERSPSSTPPPPSQTPSFEGARILSALGMDEDEERPPYAPSGYDPRPPHSSEVARWLSILAPGAGQIYNGDDHRAFDYGVRFMFIKPWIDAATDAARRGEKIATHWAPRPEDGHLFRAFRYMGLWYLTNLFVLIVLFGVVGVVKDQVTRRSGRDAALSPADVSLAVKDAKLDVLAARIQGLDAVGDALETLQNERSMLSPEERLQRLFIRGLEDCQRSKFALCEETMRRVNELSQNQHRDALRLQTWAAMRRQGGSSAPMPEVATDVRSLEEYEQRQGDVQAMKGADMGGARLADGPPEREVRSPDEVAREAPEPLPESLDDDEGVRDGAPAPREDE